MIILPPNIVERALNLDLESVSQSIRADIFLLYKFGKSPNIFMSKYLYILNFTDKTGLQTLVFEYAVKQNNVLQDIVHLDHYLPWSL